MTIKCKRPSYLRLLHVDAVKVLLWAMPYGRYILCGTYRTHVLVLSSAIGMLYCCICWNVCDLCVVVPCAVQEHCYPL